MEKEKLVEEILELEYKFFISTKDTEGVASCQLDREEFIIMRKSQWINYTKDILVRYLNDLHNAINENRNIVQEKYLYMMKNSEPLEYEKIKFILPHYETRGHEVLINQISKIYMKQAEKFYEDFPYFTKECRPLYKKDDTVYRVSVETYLMGELYSYSTNTLLHLLDYMKKLDEENKNILYIINNTVVKMKNMGSIENVEEYLKNF